MENSKQMVFDYTWARTYIGIVALLIALGSVVLHNINQIETNGLVPQSISHTYHSGARDFFVSQLFVVAAFLFSYRGHTGNEWLAAKIAAIATVLVAWFPTSCKLNSDMICEQATFGFVFNNPVCTARVHYIAAIILFVSLIYFTYCFYKRAKSKHAENPNSQGIMFRKLLYFYCGIAMTFTIIVGGLLHYLAIIKNLNLIFWIETICLSLFGIVWLVAGKKVPFFK